MRKLYTFAQLSIGQWFYLGGTLWKKRTTRTGESESGRIFYFGQKESVVPTTKE